MVVRNLVLVMLCVTVVAPIVLYTHRIGTFKSASSRNEYLEEVTAFTLNGDSRHLNVLPQESSTTLKEPVGVVYTENSTKDVKLVDYKSARVLSATVDENRSQRKNPIKQVTDGARKEDHNGILRTSDTGHEDKGGRERKTAKSSSRVTEGATGNGGLLVEDQSTKSSGTSKEKEPEKQNEPALLPDARVRQLKDQLIRAKVYLSLPSTRNNPHFVRELRLRIKEVQRILGAASKDSELPKSSYDKLKAMEQTLAKGKLIQDDCAAIVKKLRAMLHSTEEQLRVHRKQTLFLTQLTAKTIPKGLHCLPLRLTSEYYTLNSSQQQFPNQEKLEDPSLFHYALFSDNVLAAAVVVNSTISNAKDPEKHVFHIVTDRLNYAAMRMWFLVNPLGKAAVQVQNIQEFTWLNASYSPVLKQLGSASMIDYYFRTHRASSDSNLKFRNPKYLSILNHLRFYLPEVFPKLNKVLFLDDDIVVQKDLSALWSINLKGNVIGVVETCGESFHRFDRYLNFSNPLIAKNFNARACGWAYGMNIFDLNEWRRQNITEIYHKWQELNHGRLLWKLGTLPPGLITYWKRTFSLDRSWHVLGLGYNPSVSQKDIERAAVIHYNGNMKPWLEIGIPKYRNYWAKYVDYDQAYLRECNINP
ncbi:hypothetical protein CDL15_Pgr029095 [Punica granatum]|uniref:Hexosyltransferase n=3 Tax=Punica granatum TaxID=22663 RepID=A0A218XN01_PUNGR|nr:hypothetical protein CDL15_Pgr029095 [Punica granatum]